MQNLPWRVFEMLQQVKELLRSSTSSPRAVVRLTRSLRRDLQQLANVIPWDLEVVRRDYRRSHCRLVWMRALFFHHDEARVRKCWSLRRARHGLSAGVVMLLYTAYHEGMRRGRAGNTRLAQSKNTGSRTQRFLVAVDALWCCFWVSSVSYGVSDCEGMEQEVLGPRESALPSPR